MAERELEGQNAKIVLPGTFNPCVREFVGPRPDCDAEKCVRGDPGRFSTWANQ